MDNLIKEVTYKNHVIEIRQENPDFTMITDPVYYFRIPSLDGFECGGFLNHSDLMDDARLVIDSDIDSRDVNPE